MATVYRWDWKLRYASGSAWTCGTQLLAGRHSLLIWCRCKLGEVGGKFPVDFVYGLVGITAHLVEYGRCFRQMWPIYLMLELMTLGQGQ